MTVVNDVTQIKPSMSDTVRHMWAVYLSLGEKLNKSHLTRSERALRLELERRLSIVLGSIKEVDDVKEDNT